MNSIIKNILWWGGILLLQFVLIFFLKPTLFFTPYIYILLLFRVQRSFSRMTILFIAFLLGLFIDGFTNSLGVHMAVCTLIAFLLPYFTGIFSPILVDEDVKFSLENIGYFRFSIILFMVYFIYHLCTNILWDFTFSHLGYQLLKSVIATVFATVISLLIYKIFSKNTEQDNG